MGGNSAFDGAELLEGLSARSSEQLLENARTIHLQAGQWLFREGEAAESAFLVRSGRIEIVADGARPEAIRTVKRGGLIGELALLTRTVRSASARALRDSQLLELSRETFERIILDDHQFVRSLCARLGSQLASHRSPAAGQDRPSTVSIVALDEGVPVDAVVERLAASLSSGGKVTILREDAADYAAEHVPLLERAESASRWVILVATPDPSDAWTRLCLADADRVLALTRGRPRHEWQKQLGALRGCELLVLDSRAPESLLAAIGPRRVQALADETALQRSLAVEARRISGRSVGVVLSGGGARALAHLGVIEELRAAGVQIDRVGGASMGALVAACVAQDLDDETIYEGIRRFFVEQNPISDYTLPAYSLIRGRKTHRGLGEVFGATRIEQLPLRFFCVSADLNDRSLMVHRLGPVRDAVLASLSIPGVFPPVRTPQGGLLVDGGVLDNLPVETMAKDGDGPVIAVDVTRASGWQPPPVPPSVWQARARSLISGQPAALPRLAETVLATLALGSRDTLSAAGRHADLLITPEPEHAGLLDWKQLPKMRAAGRDAVRSLLRRQPDALERLG